MICVRMSANMPSVNFKAWSSRFIQASTNSAALPFPPRSMICAVSARCCEYSSSRTSVQGDYAVALARGELLEVTVPFVRPNGHLATAPRVRGRFLSNQCAAKLLKLPTPVPLAARLA